MKITTTHSFRKFKIIHLDREDVQETTISLDELCLDDGSEMNYSLQEEMDKILDLKMFESMFCHTSRDDKESNKAIIIRVD